jgi:hypothetical protein
MIVKSVIFGGCYELVKKKLAMAYN